MRCNIAPAQRAVPESPRLTRNFMSDFYLELTQSPVGRRVVSSLGLPTPPSLARNDAAWPEQPLTDATVALGAGPGGRVTTQLADAVTGMGGAVVTVEGFDNGADVPASGTATAGSDDAPGTKLHAAVFDATGLSSPAELRALYDFYHPIARQVQANGRLLVVGTPPESAKGVAAKTAARALEGFVRSLGKEFGKKGITAMLILVEPGAEAHLAGPVRFALSKPSAFVTGQTMVVSNTAKGEAATTWAAPLAGKVALVTGAARGIGEAIAVALAREGAQVICLDRPGEEEALAEVTANLATPGGKPLAVDITSEHAPSRIAAFVTEQFSGVDIVVHNAGVTRDKTLARMSEQWWDMVLDINLGSILEINDALTTAPKGKKAPLRDGGRVICVSSIGGIAGNFGQTNYAASKAGVIGYVAALSETLAKRGITVNAAAPGFIETRMTAAMPFGVREAGRRLNALSQGGMPEDVAELITFFATPGAQGVTGQTVRVCGQNLVGA